MTKRSRIVGALFSILCLYQTGPALAGTKWEQYSQAAERAYNQRNFSECERNFLQALKEAERFEKTDKRLATTVYNLALVYQQQEKFDLCEQTYGRALGLLKGIHGDVHERIAQIYLDLGDLYRTQAADDDKKDEFRKKAAEQYKLACEVLAQVYNNAKSGNSPETGGKTGEQLPEPTKAAPPITAKEAGELRAKALKTFADFYAEEDEFTFAEPLYRQALELEILELGDAHQEVIKDKAHLAEFYCVQGKYEQAEPYFKDALAGGEKVWGAESKDFADVLYKAGGLYYDQGAYAQAEDLFRRALKVFEKNKAAADDIAMKSLGLADVLDMQGKNEEAHNLYTRLIATLDNGKEDNEGLLAALKQYHKHLLMRNDKAEASKISARIKELKSNRP